MGQEKYPIEYQLNTRRFSCITGEVPWMRLSGGVSLAGEVVDDLNE